MTLGVTKLAGLTRIRSWVNCSSQELGSRHAHHLDPDGTLTEIFDVRRRVGTRPGEAHPRRVGRRLREQPPPQPGGQAGQHGELTAHHAECLGVPEALGGAREPVLPGELAELIDDLAVAGLLAGKQLLLGQAEMRVRPARVLQRLRGREQRRPELLVEPGPVEELQPALEPPHPQEQVAQRAEDEVGGQALRFSEQAAAACGDLPPRLARPGQHGLHFGTPVLVEERSPVVTWLLPLTEVQGEVEDTAASPEDEPEEDARGYLADLVTDLAGDEGRLRVVEYDAGFPVVPAVLLVDRRLDRPDAQGRHEVLQAPLTGVHDLAAPRERVAERGGHPGGAAAGAEEHRAPSPAVRNGARRPGTE